MLNVLVAADSYKGSLSSGDFIRAVQEAAARCGNVTVRGIPIADGGEGVLDAILGPLHGERMECEVTDPLGRKISVEYGLAGHTAIIEMARCSGLTLLTAEERNPLYTTSYGLGEVIRCALDRPEVETIIVGIGGSATNDGGVGMAQALGLRALDADGEQALFGGIHVGEIVQLDTQGLHPRIKEVSIRVMCDVSNPLYGRQGATAVYGPQKGATLEMVELLDGNLRHLARQIHRTLGIDVSELPGGGAAGGVGAALAAFCGASLDSGITVMLDLFHFEEAVRDADLVITGEGRTDAQTAYGKAVAGVARRAKACGKTVVCLSGALGVGRELLYELGVDSLFSICPGPVSEEFAMANAYALVTDAAENILRLFI